MTTFWSYKSFVFILLDSTKTLQMQKFCSWPHSTEHTARWEIIPKPWAQNVCGPFWTPVRQVESGRLVFFFLCMCWMVPSESFWEWGHFNSPSKGYLPQSAVCLSSGFSVRFREWGLLSPPSGSLPMISSAHMVTDNSLENLLTWCFISAQSWCHVLEPIWKGHVII